MTTKERRERELRETREKILDAARELFVRDGIDAVTMRRIAERIEYTPTAIYHHFRDKHALLMELCYTDFRSLARAFQQIGRIEDPVERIRRIGLAYVEFALEHPSAYRFMFMTTLPVEARPEVHTGDPEEDAYAFLTQSVAEAMAAGRFRPELTNVEQTAQILWTSVHGLVSLYLAKGDAPWMDWGDIRETSRLMIDVVMRGVLRDEAS